MYKVSIIGVHYIMMLRAKISYFNEIFYDKAHAKEICILVLYTELFRGFHGYTPVQFIPRQAFH